MMVSGHGGDDDEEDVEKNGDDDEWKIKMVIMTGLHLMLVTLL